MRVLALDTTTAAGSVAIVDDDRVLVEQTGDANKSHAERLPDDILRVLEGCRLTAGAIDVFAIASGPGTFTGLRIGIATIQGLALVTGKRVVPVSALTALARAVSDQQPAARIIGAWMDAHRRDVFSALFTAVASPAADSDHVIELEAPVVDDPVLTLARWTEEGHRPDVIVGDGATAFKALIPEAVATFGQLPLAGVIAQIALRRARMGETVDPAAIQPLYIRRPDAEIARDAIRPLAGDGPASTPRSKV